MADVTELLCQLNRAKCAFQLRTISAVIGAGAAVEATPDYHAWLMTVPGIPAGWGLRSPFHNEGSTRG